MSTLASVLVAVSLASAGAPTSRVYLIAIGNNSLPLETHEEDIEPLRFADDDAAAIYQFFAGTSARAFLLSVLDAETQARFPGLAAHARVPSWTELTRAVAELRELVAQDRSQGLDSEVILFFSGHGSRNPAGAYLALSDAPLTQERLYNEVLAQLQAHTVHLIVDACYAEAVVRPRDAGASAEVVDVSDAEVDLWNREKTLRRFPYVGAVIATAADQRAHEWDAYERGVFTHQVLSGLRGAADINLDRQIEYSELQAFLAAANSGVENPRAKLNVMVYPPQTNMRAPIVDLNRFDDVGWAVGLVANVKRFHIDEEQGRRVLDVHAEAGQSLQLALPPLTKLALRTRAGEAEFTVAVGEEISLEDLPLQPSRVVARGALDSALRRGLFAQPYGSLYYQGYVDSVGAIAVPMPGVSMGEPTEAASSTGAWVAFGTATALGIAAMVTGGLALDARAEFNATDLQRPADDARKRYDNFRYSALTTGSSALIAAGVGLWLWPWE